MGYFPGGSHCFFLPKNLGSLLGPFLHLIFPGKFLLKEFPYRAKKSFRKPGLNLAYHNGVIMGSHGIGILPPWGGIFTQTSIYLGFPLRVSF